MCPTWGIAKIFCPRGESFVLPILQIPTSAREGGGGVGLDIDRCIIHSVDRLTGLDKHLVRVLPWYRSPQVPNKSLSSP